MNEMVKQILVEKALMDLKKLKIEAKEKNLQSQLGRWIQFFMFDLQKRFPEVHKVVVEEFNSEVA